MSRTGSMSALLKNFLSSRSALNPSGLNLSAKCSTKSGVFAESHLGYLVRDVSRDLGGCFLKYSPSVVDVSRDLGCFLIYSPTASCEKSLRLLVTAAETNSQKHQP